MPIQKVLAADPVVTITVSAYGYGHWGLRINYIDDYRIKITWEKPGIATNTMIRAKLGEYPQDREDGWLIYYGGEEICWDTGTSMDVMLGTICYRGWVETATGWYDLYAETNLENPYVEEIADVVTDLAPIVKNVIAFVPIIFLSAFALWKENAVLFMIVAGMSMMAGLYGPDFVNSSPGTSNLYISIGLGMIVYSLLCSGWALRLMFWKEK